MTDSRDIKEAGQAAQGGPGTSSKPSGSVAWLLFGCAAILAAGAGWVCFGLADVTRRGYLWLSIWLALLALEAVVAGLWQRWSETGPQAVSNVDMRRFRVLTLGGLAGLLTVLLAVALAYEWWATLTGGLETWRQEWWRLALCLLALLSGLLIMLASLQLARGDERTHPGLRRLLYGYNTVLMAILLLLILGLVNVLAYVRLPPFSAFNTTFDWTAANIYTLSPNSKNVLASLKQPVKVYVLMAMGSFEQREVETLLNNCRGVTDKVEVQYVSPNDLSTIRQLIRDYQLLETKGLLVVYGSGAGREHEFINAGDLFREEPRKNGLLFEGENALIGTISNLTQGKTRAVVYFTQGNGELDLNDAKSSDAGLGIIKERLQKANYEVKDLKLNDVTATHVPADAAVVVVVRPANPSFPVKALEDYMSAPLGAGKKAGKLLVLLGIDRPGERTGLEGFLGKFNVQVRTDRILNLSSPEPLRLRVVPNPDLVRSNPIAAAFDQLAIPMEDARTIWPQTSAHPGGPMGYTAETLLQTTDQVWSETNLADAPAAIIKALLQPGRRQEFETKLGEAPLPVAVAVTSPRAAKSVMEPNDRSAGPEPRLAVVGDARWVTNSQVRDGLPNGHYELFASMLSWLRERPEIGKTAPPKERNAFVILKPREDVLRLIWLPIILMVLGILGFGGGIWLARRR